MDWIALLTLLGVAVVAALWLAAIVVGVAGAIKQPALLAAYPVALVGLPWRWNTAHVLNKLGRAAVSSVIAVATFVAISLATGLNFGWINALDVPGRVVTLAPLSLIGEGIRLLCVAAGRPELGTQIAGGLLVILFGIWTLPGPHQHWLMGH